MQEKDVVSSEYLENPKRFADLINGFLFSGEQRVRPENITEMNRVITSVWKKSEWIRAQIKIRDIMRQVDFGLQVILVAIENQSDVHYAMPVRVMASDAAVYSGQVQQKKREHEKRNDLKGAEYLSGFSKTDKLSPTITIVVYWGREPWDGPKSIREMMDLTDIPEDIQECVEDYHIKVLEVRKYLDLDNFKTDLKYVFGFLQNAENRKELEAYVYDNKKFFENMPEDAYDMIRIMSNSTELKAFSDTSQKEGTNMCGGLQEIYDDGVKQGMQLVIKIFKLHKCGASYSEIAEECSIPIEQVKTILEDDAA